MHEVDSFLTGWATAERAGDIVTARNNTRGSYRGHPVPETVRATLVLTREASDWRLAALHVSFIAGTSGAPPVPGGGGRPGPEGAAR